MEVPKKLIDQIKNASNIVALTGAGVSAESGIKTFRDPDGLWAKFNPMELASVEGFLNNPQLVWEWYQHRVDIINNSQPNPGHFALAELENISQNFTLITQNVDRLHQKAGSKNVLELHGNIVENHCFKCKKPYVENILKDSAIPVCTHCGGNIRPSVVWFGEMLPEKALSNAEKATSQSDIFFTIGTSSEVYPAASLPIKAKNSGAIVIEINPNETSFSRYADYKFSFPSGEILPEIIKQLKV